MSKSTLELLEFEEEIAKRASWEAFEFTLLGDGDVEVVNGSHDEPEDHTYIVHVEGGIPSDCTCPAFEYQEGACKHMVAVAIREPVLEAATAEPAMKADGGLVEAEETDESDEEECWCEDHDMPCFECFLEGRRGLPEV